ncbi:MAG: hypothetical protein U5L09_07530 [Bacteroidales bacterium]|nr:hypothetical protein [Bacteroidales bacterium]
MVAEKPLGCTLCRKEPIRDVIAFPKNNAGRNVMIDSLFTSKVTQGDELHLEDKKEKDASVEMIKP